MSVIETSNNINSNVINKNNVTTLGQQYDTATYTWGSIVISSINANNCFIQSDGYNFKIYANGSIHILIAGNETYTIKYITFDEKEPLPIAANEYQEDIDDVNMTSHCTLTIEGGSVSSANGEFHIVTLFDNNIQIFSNDGVEEITWLSKVPIIGDDKVYRIFYTRGDFLFTWSEQKELSTIKLYAANDDYTKGTYIKDIVSGATKTILPSGVFETHYVLELTNTVGDIEDCIVCAQNLNLGVLNNPFRNFWYSFNGEQYPINDLDGGKLWCKLRGYNPLKYNDLYLQQLDDLTINKLILLSTNWPTPIVNPSKITLTGGSSEIETASGYAARANNPYYIAAEPIGADTTVEYKIYYSGEGKPAPDFLYINAGGYFCIKANTWEVYPDGRLFDVIAYSTKNSVVSENKLIIKVIITGEPTPRITDVVVSNIPETIVLKPNETYLSPSPVAAVVNSDGGSVPQDITYSLSNDKEIPNTISINQEGYIFIGESDLDNYELHIKVICTSNYNDSYSGQSSIIKIYINKAGAIPGKSWLNIAIVGSAIGGVLIMCGGLLWWRDYVSKKRKTKALTRYNQKYGNEKYEPIKEQKSNIKIKNNARDDGHVSTWTKFKDWFTMKDVRSKPKKGEKDGNN